MANPFEHLIPTGNLKVTTGRGGNSAAEDKAGRSQLDKAMLGRNVLEDLAYIEAMNRKVPATGRFAENVLKTEQELPSGWQRSVGGLSPVAAYQMMLQRSRGMVKPVAGLLGGGGVSGKEMDAAKELDYWSSTVPQPGQERAAVTGIADHIGKRALEAMAREAFTTKWRQTYGSDQSPNKDGETLSQAYNRFLASPKSAPIHKPISQYLTEAQRRRLAAQGAAQPSGDEIEALIRKHGG